MSSDRLGHLLWETAIPAADTARERAVTAARAATPTSRLLVTPIRRRRPASAWARRRAFAIACVTLLVAAAALTSPGRSALSEAADLLGQIGGEPTADDNRGGLDPVRPAGEPGGPTVLDNGVAPDGSRYEWFAYRSKEKGLGETFCVVFGWTGEPRRKGTGGCGSIGSWSPGILTGFQARLIRPPSSDSPDRDYMLIGSLAPRVHRLRILYRRPDGSQRDLPVDLGRVEGELLKQGGGTRPFVTFTAFIPSETVRADRLDERYRLASLTTRRASALAVPGIVEQDASLQCMQRHGGIYRRGWVHFKAYDAKGRQIASLPTLTSRARPPECQRIFERQRERMRGGARLPETPR